MQGPPPPQQNLNCLTGKESFLAGQESQECCVYISDAGIRGIYLSLTLGTAKFKQLDQSYSDKEWKKALLEPINLDNY